MKNCTVYEGHARFESAVKSEWATTGLRRIRSSSTWVAARVVPDMPGLDQVEYLTNSSMMGVDFLPRHLIVVGGSYIGLEFGQMFRRFGSEVTILEMGPRLVSREDEDVSAAIQEILEEEGIRVRTEREVHRTFEARRGDLARAECKEGRRKCRIARAAGGGAASEYRRPRAGKGRHRGRPSTGTSWWTINCARTFRASGRWAIAMGRARSRTRRTTISRLSPRIFWTTIRGA